MSQSLSEAIKEILKAKYQRFRIWLRNKKSHDKIKEKNRKYREILKKAPIEARNFFFNDVLKRYFLPNEQLGPYCQVTDIPHPRFKELNPSRSVTYQFTFLGITSERAFIYQFFRLYYHPNLNNEGKIYSSNFVSAPNFDWIKIQKLSIDIRNPPLLKLILATIFTVIGIVTLNSYGDAGYLVGLISLVLGLGIALLTIISYLKSKKKRMQMGLSFKIADEIFEFPHLWDEELQQIELFIKFVHNKSWISSKTLQQRSQQPIHQNVEVINSNSAIPNAASTSEGAEILNEEFMPEFDESPRVAYTSEGAETLNKEINPEVGKSFNVESPSQVNSRPKNKSKFSFFTERVKKNRHSSHLSIITVDTNENKITQDQTNLDTSSLNKEDSQKPMEIDLETNDSDNLINQTTEVQSSSDTEDSISSKKDDDDSSNLSVKKSANSKDKNTNFGGILYSLGLNAYRKKDWETATVILNRIHPKVLDGFKAQILLKNIQNRNQPISGPTLYYKAFSDDSIINCEIKSFTYKSKGKISFNVKQEELGFEFIKNFLYLVDSQLKTQYNNKYWRVEFYYFGECIYCFQCDTPECDEFELLLMESFDITKDLNNIDEILNNLPPTRTSGTESPFKTTKNEDKPK